MATGETALNLVVLALSASPDALKAHVQERARLAIENEALRAKVSELEHRLLGANVGADEMRRDNEKLREALGEYAKEENWAQDEEGVSRMWLEPGSSTPEVYHGHEHAQKALTPSGTKGGNDNG